MNTAFFEEKPERTNFPAFLVSAVALTRNAGKFVRSGFSSKKAVFTTILVPGGYELASGAFGHCFMWPESKSDEMQALFLSNKKAAPG